MWPSSLSRITLGDAENKGDQLFNKSQHFPRVFLTDHHVLALDVPFVLGADSNCDRRTAIFCLFILSHPESQGNPADRLSTHSSSHLGHYTVPVIPLFFQTSSLSLQPLFCSPHPYMGVWRNSIQMWWYPDDQLIYAPPTHVILLSLLSVFLLVLSHIHVSIHTNLNNSTMYLYR